MDNPTAGDMNVKKRTAFLILCSGIIVVFILFLIFFVLFIKIEWNSWRRTWWYYKDEQEKLTKEDHLIDNINCKWNRLYLGLLLIFLILIYVFLSWIWSHFKYIFKFVKVITVQQIEATK